MPGPLPPSAAAEPARQRLDRWLWFTRVVKSRSLAAKLVADGHVRVNSVRVEAASKAVKVGDVVTIALDRNVRVFKVLAAGVRRGPAPEARQLYEDLAPRTGPAPADTDEDGSDEDGLDD